MSGAFDRPGQLALVPGAGAGLAARPDFSIIRHETAQGFPLLVIDGGAFVIAELTLSRPGEKTPRRALSIIGWGLRGHYLSPSKFRFFPVHFLHFILIWIFFSRLVIRLRSILTALSALFQHDHLVGYDLHRRVFDAFVVFPMSGLKTSFDVNQVIL